MRRLRQAVLGSLAVAGIVAVAGTGGANGAAAAKQPPNVIVLMTDDQAAASQSVMTHTNELIGDQGATFANSFVSWPLCCPSRATFLTGQYGHNHGVLGNAPPLGGFDRLDNSETLAVWLQRAGYYTVEIGKYLNRYEQSSVGVPEGWSEWHGTKRTYTYYGEQLLEDGQLNTYGSPRENPDNPAQPETYATDVFNDKAVQVIGERAPSAQPFFLYVAYLAPHGGAPEPRNGDPPSRCAGTAKPAARHIGTFASAPLPRPPNFNEADVSDKPGQISGLPPLTATRIAEVTREYRCRLESLLAVDDGVRRIVEALERQGELDNTLLVYTSDNGLFAGEHRLPEGKSRAYEEAIRVPLVIRGPGIPAGVQVGELASNADLAPTILDAADAEPGRVQDGESLLPFIRHPERRHGRELLIEQYGSNLTATGQPPLLYAGVRTSRYKFVQHGDGELELYDLAADPYELQNLNGKRAYTKAMSSLASRLEALRECSGESCRRRPSVRLKLPRPIRSQGHSCRSPRGFVARLRGSGARSVSSVNFSVGSKPAGRDRRQPLKGLLRPRLLRAKHRPQIGAFAELVDGRELSLRKRVRICR